MSSIFEGMPLWPGHQKPFVMVNQTHEGFKERFGTDLGFEAHNWLMSEHTGTHTDAIFEYDPNGADLDHMPLEYFYGEAVCLDVSHVRHPDWKPWQSLKARALAQLGRGEEALTAMEAELALARGVGGDRVIGRCLRQLAELEGEDGEPRLEEAIERLRRTPARLELARALGALGALQRRLRRPTEAREPLRQALELAEACGATTLVESVRSELYATGARPRSAALAGVDSLTARELRVATLARDGQTNREIAQTLFVTPKTVEVHLSSAYRKLDIRSRRDLAGALG